ncbi:MAG: ATP-binding cassette domain-containing protein, partial [Pseudomonadota bacterium]
MHWPLARAAKRAHEDGAAKHGVLVETLGGLETLKAAGAQARMRSRWETATGFAGETAARSRFLSGLAVNGSHFIQQAATVAIVAIGVLQIAEGAMSAGALIACVILSSRALAPLSQIANLLTRLHHALQAYRTVDGLMTAETERPPGRAFLQRGRFDGAIAFDGVSFTYPGHSLKALDRVSVTIDAGMRVGVLGKVGSGKSTLHRLMLGLYAPDEGAIRIDGADLRQIDPLDLRQAVGYVGQDVVLFRGSLRDNIALSAPEAEDGAILAAAALAGVDEFAARHPDGYDLTVGERGEGLSGGQKQAVGLARALLRDPPILQFDEPTTGFDVAGEIRFRERMSAAAHRKTLVM